MKTIGFSFNDFDFIVHSFQNTGMEWVITVIDEAIAVSFQSVDELGYGSVLKRSRQGTPMIQGFGSPGSRFIGPDVF
jgi:hypothetical protein